QTSWGSMGVKSFDVDNDGQFDLLITDMHSDMSEDIRPERESLKSRMQWPESFLASQGRGLFGNTLFRKVSGNRFEEISDQFGAENYWPWGISVADLNADGYLDVFVASSMCFPYRYGINSLWLNDRGERFLSAEFALGIEPRRPDNLIKPWFELDCDGLDRDNPICRGRSGKLVVWSCRGTRSAAIFDLDGDGDLDIITNEFNSRPMALISDLSDRREVKWVQIRLQGTRSNRDGLGAIVRLKLPTGAILTQRHDGKSGYLSQSSMPLYFGLGESSEVTAIDILWPSGTTQHLAGPIASGQTLIVEESTSDE
ncbi:MAG TPA: CRTAC1 family protein, partial [Planctomycetaceae bacterium]|nr:CRTAC1 family protein [Planctomycetaceae bacterium]